MTKGKVIEPKPPEEETPDYDSLSGPELKLRYDSDERESVLINADPKFGPFLVVIFREALDSRLSIFPGNGISVDQMKIIQDQLELMRSSIRLDAMAKQIRESQDGIIRPKDFQMKPGPAPRSKKRRRRRH